MKRFLLALTLLAGYSSFASAQPLAVAQAGPLGLSGTTCVPGASSTATSCLLLNVTGLGTASVSISGTYSGTITFTGSNGGPYVNVGCTSTAAGSAAANTTTGTGTFICPVAGLRILEANITSYSSGTAVAWMLGAPGGGAAGGGASGSVTQGTNPWVITGDGTAGSPSAGVASVQGEVGMIPLAVSSAQSGAYTVGQSGSPWGVLGTLSNNNAAPGSNQLPVMPALANAAVPSYTEGRQVLASTDLSGRMRTITDINNGSATATDAATLTAGVASTASTDSFLFKYNGTTYSRVVGDPCELNAKSYGVIDLASSTATELIAGTSAKKTYICSISVITATAQNVGIWSGTTTTTACDTGKGKMFGGSMAATGWNFAANGGIVLGTGVSSIAATGANADKVCITSSSTGQLSGNYSYVVQ